MGLHTSLGFSTRRSLVLFSTVTVIVVTILSTWLGDLARRGSLWVLDEDRSSELPKLHRPLTETEREGRRTLPVLTLPHSSAVIQHTVSIAQSLTVAWHTPTPTRQFTYPYTHGQEKTTSSLTSSQRFLLPILPFGPNNQFRALREAIVLSLWLNRAIVLPPFFKHYTSKDNQQEPELTPAEEIFDVDKLRGLLPVVSGSDFAKACHGRLEVLFQVRVPTYPSQFHRITKLFALLKLKQQDYLSTRAIRQPRESPPNDVIRVTSQKVARHVFSSKAKCAAVLFPFKAVDISRHLVPLALYLQHTKRLKELASHYVTTVMEGQPYMAVHWRYNSDWASTWCHQGVGSKYNEVLVKDPHHHGICRVLGVEHEKVTMSIQLLVKKYKMSYVYVATPLAERSPLMKLLRASIPTLLASKELLEIIGKEAKDISDTGLTPIDTNFELSLVEQELCLGSSVFVGSQKSTWSENVAFERVGLKHRTREMVEPVLWMNKVLFPQ